MSITWTPSFDCSDGAYRVSPVPVLVRKVEVELLLGDGRRLADHEFFVRVAKPPGRNPFGEHLGIGLARFQ